jgi:two-component system response regulator
MNSRTILLVEDNPSDVALTKRALERSRISNKLVVADDGVEALDYLFCTGTYADRDICDLPTVVLLDLKLPKVGGIDVLKQIRSHEITKRLPVVIMTSSKEDVDIASAYDNGANSYVHKPVDFNQFSNAVNQLGLYWLVINEPPPQIL